jgi:hypothetical protein
MQLKIPIKLTLKIMIWGILFIQATHNLVTGLGKVKAECNPYKMGVLQNYIDLSFGNIYLNFEGLTHQLWFSIMGFYTFLERLWLC